jgi:hypothetical protein
LDDLADRVSRASSALLAGGKFWGRAWVGAVEEPLDAGEPPHPAPASVATSAPVNRLVRAGTRDTVNVGLPGASRYPDAAT